MRRRLSALLLAAAFILAPPAPAARAYTLQYNSSGSVLVRWPASTITVALSLSLQAPPPNVKAGSDVVGAARRALARWAEVSNIQFNVTTSANDAVQADGVNLITVSQANAALFNSPERSGRARVTFDPNSGAIVEADVALNPNTPFSTDGTPDTFDLESAFVHEIGHMLGLEHSGIVGATMQPRLTRNGTYTAADQTALVSGTVRTLSQDDVAGIRALYGPLAGLGSVAGTISAASGAVFGAHVSAQEVSTGRAVAGNATLPNGSYRIDGLPPGQYRLVVEPLDEPVAASEIASQGGPYTGLRNLLPSFRTFETDALSVASDATTPFNVLLVNAVQPFINPRFVGINSRLSSTPAPLVPGQTVNALVGGNNLHQVGAGGVSVTSDFIRVDPASVQQLVFQSSTGEQVQVLSFNVTASILTPPGDYSLRLLSTAGEVAYVSGGLTVDPPFGTTAATPNPLDDAQFFVAQHYRDFLNREPDAAGLAFWAGQISGCGGDAACAEVKRVNTSAAYFLSIEFQQTGYLVYRFYHAAYGRRVAGLVPLRFEEFLPETQRLQRGVVVNQGDWEARLEANKRAYAEEFVARPEFLAQYPRTLSPEQYVDALNANAEGALSAGERDALAAGLRAGTETRATVLRRVAEDADEVARERNRAFVLMQYFGYLRRDPDAAPDNDFAGYNFWLAKLNSFNGDYVGAEMVKAFITSGEYRRRFSAAG